MIMIKPPHLHLNTSPLSSSSPTLSPSLIDSTIHNNNYDDDDDHNIDEWFMMYQFKVRPCTHPRPHDWTHCPFLHPSEKARRRDPLTHSYSPTSCPLFRTKGACSKGDSCPLSHGVFESWLHPSRFRTHPCKDGATCRRRVCFFAHSPLQLRRLTSTGDVVMARVESGRALRARMVEKLSKENGLSGPGPAPLDLSELGPDLGWVSDLIN